MRGPVALQRHDGIGVAPRSPHARSLSRSDLSVGAAALPVRCILPQ